VAAPSFNFKIKRGDTFNGASYTLAIYRTYPTLASFPAIGDVSLIYRATDTGLTYAWNGTTYVTTANKKYLDLRGATFLCQFRSEGNNDVVISLTEGHGITIDDAINGRFSIDPFTLIASILEGSYYFDVRITFSNGTIRHYVPGTMTVLPTSSR
jgi:hypothetical protein